MSQLVDSRYDIDSVLATLLDALDEVEAQWNEQTLFAAGYIRPLIDCVYADSPRNMDSFFASIDAELQKHSRNELSSEDSDAVMQLWAKIRSQCKNQFV